MEFQALIKERRSIRAYSEEQKVTKEMLKELIEAAQMAPSWKNSQTGRYYAVSEGDMWERVWKALPSFNQNNSKNAALIVTTFVKNVSGHTNGMPDNEVGNGWGAYDLGLQNAFLILKASDMGLGTLIMGIRDAAAIREALSIPEEEEIVSVISVGYKAQEPANRPRKAAEDISVIY